jgi:hypothetical protein
MNDFIMQKAKLSGDALRLQSFDILTRKLKLQFTTADKFWMQRKRKLNTASIFNSLTAAFKYNRGLNHVIQAEDSIFTAQALSVARRKLPRNLFRDINRSLQTQNSLQPRVFAVDGSKVHVHPSFTQFGCKSRTNDKPVARIAKRPLIMLSSLFDVKSRTCVHSVSSTHFNERLSAQQHFKVCKPGDTVIFDRGYYSKLLLQEASQRDIRVVFRLKCDAFLAARKFFTSSRTYQSLRVLNTVSGSFDMIYLYKYFIDGRAYMCLSNFDCTVKKIKDLYAQRWTVETSFRRLKTNLNLEKSHSMSLDLFVQEIQALILLDTITMMITPSSTNSHKSSYYQTLDKVQMVLYILSESFLHCLSVTFTLRMVKQHVSDPHKIKHPKKKN